MKRKIRLLVSCVLMCVLCSFTVLAAEDGNQVQPRFPGLAGIKSVKAFAIDKETNKPDKSAYTIIQVDMEQWGDLTLNAATTALYKENGGNEIYVEVTFDRYKADMYEIYADGKMVEKGNFTGGYYPGFYETFGIYVPVVDNHADWKIILYDAIDANVHGLPLSGRVTIP